MDDRWKPPSDREKHELWVSVVHAIETDPELARYSAAVKDLFAQVTTKYIAPEAVNCRTIIMYLRMQPAPPSKAPKSGKLFLKYLEPDRRDAEDSVSSCRSTYWQAVREEWLREQQEFVERSERVREDIAWLNSHLAPKRDRARDPVRRLAEVAQQLWADANDGKFPESTSRNSPLCRFVSEAFKLVGEKVGPQEVSNILRGQRRIT